VLIRPSLSCVLACEEQSHRSCGTAPELLLLGDAEVAVLNLIKGPVAHLVTRRQTVRGGQARDCPSAGYFASASRKRGVEKVPLGMVAWKLRGESAVKLLLSQRSQPLMASKREGADPGAAAARSVLRRGPGGSRGGCVAARWAGCVSTLLTAALHVPLKLNVDIVCNCKTDSYSPCKTLASHADMCGTPPRRDGVGLAAPSTSSFPESPTDTPLCSGFNFFCAVGLVQGALCSLMSSGSPQDSSNNHNKLLSRKAPRERR